MGCGMALNLRAKLDKSATFYICDISKEAIDLFKTESDGHGPVEIVKNGADAVMSAVSQIQPVLISTSG